MIADLIGFLSLFRRRASATANTPAKSISNRSTGRRSMLRGGRTSEAASTSPSSWTAADRSAFVRVPEKTIFRTPASLRIPYDIAVPLAGPAPRPYRRQADLEVRLYVRRVTKAVREA